MNQIVAALEVVVAVVVVELVVTTKDLRLMYSLVVC